MERRNLLQCRTDPLMHCPVPRDRGTLNFALLYPMVKLCQPDDLYEAVKLAGGKVTKTTIKSYLESNQPKPGRLLVLRRVSGSHMLPL